MFEKFAGALCFAGGLFVGHSMGMYYGASLIKNSQLEQELAQKKGLQDK